MPFLLGSPDNEKLAYEISNASLATDLGPHTLRRAIKDGRLRAGRVYGRTLILREDLVRFLRDERDRASQHQNLQEAA